MLEGIIDFEHNIPSRDVILLASATNLVARSQLHPALIDLLLQARVRVVVQINKGGRK
jgi:hypothetical protein